jgi:hypothetical protein
LYIAGHLDERLTILIWNFFQGNEVKAFSDNSGTELRWVQSSRLESKLLTIQKEEVASLVWENLAGSLATGESSEGKWSMKRVGFLDPKITIREAGSDRNLAVLSLSLTGQGTLQFDNGTIYNFQKLRDGLSAVDSSGEKILLLKPIRRGLNIEALIVEQKTKDENLAILSILSWHVVLLLSNYDHDTAFIASMVAII